MEETLIKRSMPNSLDAEQSVIGSMIIDKDAILTAMEMLTSDDFYHKQYGILFDAMIELYSKGLPVDLITLQNKLKEKEVPEEISSLSYVKELLDAVPTSANIKYYAKIVKDNSMRRRLIRLNEEIENECYAGKESIDTVMDMTEKKVFDLLSTRGGGGDYVPIRQVVMNALEKIENAAKTSGTVTGIPTGFIDLDYRTAGLQPSDLILIAARPSMGKTTFAMNLCENAAMASDKPVLVFSLEMPAEQIMMRMIASLARVDQTKIRTGQNLDETEWSKIASVFGMFKQKNNLYIDDSSGLTPTELRSRARRVYRENGGLSMIMVDYLQLMRAPAFSDNRTLEIAEISRSLKALAKELEVPVIALSQLNRTLEQRADKRPVNSDLRESGSIEQDADLIMFIYRDEVYNDNSEDKGVAEIIIGKQRNGPIGRVRLAFNGQFSRFDNLAEQREYRDDY